MQRSEIKLRFGFKDGQLFHISEVENGLRCGCVCASCKEPLVAKKGNATTHHFAHYRSVECEKAVETALHLAAKQVLAENCRINLPRVLIGFESNRQAIEISGMRVFNLDVVVLERRLGDVVPDIIAYVQNVPLLIEIKVTHGVDDVKASKIRELGISAIEIDLSKAPRELSFEELIEAVVEDTANKKWIYNFKADTYRQALIASGETKRKVFRQSGTHVDNCPINARIWKGKSYANLNGDCFQCKFLIELRKLDVVCGGKEKISTLKQLKKVFRRIENPKS